MPFCWELGTESQQPGASRACAPFCFVLQRRPQPGECKLQPRARVLQMAHLSFISGQLNTHSLLLRGVFCVKCSAGKGHGKLLERGVPSLLA